MTLLLALTLAAAPLRFDEAVQRALEAHPALRVAEADARRARAQLEAARAPSLPSLSVNVVGTQLDDDRRLNDRVIFGATQLGANVNLQAPLVAPARWAGWRRAAAAAEAAVLGAADARRVVAVTAGRAWLSVLAQQRVVAASERAEAVAQAHLASARDRRAAGLGSELDEIRAAQELAVSRQQLAAARGTLARLREQLGVAVGADEPLDAADVEPPLGETGAAPGIDARLDVKAARGRREAAQVGASWEWADYMPLLSAVLQPAYQNPPTLTVPLWSFQAQLVLSIPLYDGGLRYAQQRERRAAAEQAEALLEQAERQASSEVRAALAQVKEADLALRAARDAAAQASRTLTLAQDAFRAGAATNIEVVDAERRARDADTAVALAEDAARQARLELLAASGAFPAP